MGTTHFLAAVLCAMAPAAMPSGAIGQTTTPTPSAPTVIPFPHPVITEVMFNVPRGDNGDADGDGLRNAIGDEFIELFNPHTEAIDLRGYTLRNRIAFDDPSSPRGISFVFPEFELEPGGVVIIFNGYESGLAGPVGTPTGAPKDVHPDFAGAWVFSMQNNSRFNALANGGDWIVLQSPRGKRIECVAWGKPDPAPPDGALRLENVSADPKGSVQRAGADEPLIPHGRMDGRPWSPGEIPAPP